MIDVQHAAKIAVEYCVAIFGKIERVHLEEVELTHDDRRWLITVGFDAPQTGQTDEIREAILGLEPLNRKRQYRVVDIDAQTATVRAVKIRQPLERVS